MKTTPGQPRLRHPAAVAALLSACALAPLSRPLFAQTRAVTGFDDQGWNADDVRTSAGVNIVNSTTHAALAGATLDETGVAAQIDWRNLNGSLGNLGGVSLAGTSTNNGKSTISLVNTATGLADAATALGSGFGASYRWQNTDTVAAGISFKIGIQSTAWTVSQAAFDATRSGEATWDLLLVFDPSQPGNTPGNTTVNGAFVTSTVDHATSKFFLFGQAGNTHFATPGGASAQTLAEWAADPVWGALLFGAGAKVSNTQFGVGSGNAGASAILDHASVGYLNSGARIDFVDAVRHAGTGTDFGDAATWGGIAPSSTQNLVVGQNATLDISGPRSARSLGVLAGATGIVLAEGSGLVLNSAENGTLSAASGASVGVSGPGALQAAVIEAGGTIDLASIVALDGGATPHPVRDGTSPTAKSRYGLVVLQGGVVNLQSGADVTLKNDTGVNGFKTMIRVGEVSGASGPGVLDIAPGARLSAGSLHGIDSWGALHIGDWGGQGEVDQTGGDVSILGAIVIGNEGGTGVYNLSGGSIELLRPVGDNGALLVGRATNNRSASGTLNISGGSLTLGDAGGEVSLVVGGISDNVAAYANASGTVNQTGGVVRFENASLKFGRGAGAYHLSGGTLEIGGAGAISATTGGAYAFTLGGGTLKVVGSALSTSINASLANDTTSALDTNGLGATWSGNLSGPAARLTKTGLGTLSLAGSATRDLATFAVEGGSVAQADGATTLAEFMVGTADGNTGDFTLNGGSVTLAGTAPGGSAASFRVGDFGGTGTFTQKAGTTVTVGGAGIDAALNIGNQGGSGTYNLEGGDLVLAGGLNVLGRSSGSNPASSGALNVSGGVLEITNGSSLIVGNNFNRPAHGAGAVNQTGGVVRVTDGALFVAGFGDGSYDLNGGVLEVGGDGLRARYNNTLSTSTFTLGGGALKVVGSALATDVAPVLAAGTTSVINTNGLDAALPSLSGASGHLDKTGAGRLSLGSANIGALTVRGGSLEFTGAASLQSLTVQDGATLAFGTQALDVSGDVAFDNGSILALSIGALDDLGTIGVGGSLTFGGTATLTVSFADGFAPSAPATFQLFTFTSFGGSFAQVNLPTVAGHVWNTSTLATDGTLRLETAPIPEPAAAATLAGLALLGAAALRRRRRAV